MFVVTMVVCAYLNGWIHTGHHNMCTKFTLKLNSVSSVIMEETPMWYSPGDKHHLIVNQENDKRTVDI